MNKIPKIGTIVVVIEAILIGNDPDIITKVLSRPGELNDTMSKLLGVNNQKQLENRVMCENMTDFDTTITYCNKPAYCEAISDLRLATEEEKKVYRKNVELKKQYMTKILYNDKDVLPFSSPQLEL